ncbi:hypothetical protein FRC02_005597 [Tulasnella sp. 418]|nr:hypothetical protein FRC02_005597 [Tulasnella sp. 418]
MDGFIAAPHATQTHVTQLMVLTPIPFLELPSVAIGQPALLPSLPFCTPLSSASLIPIPTDHPQCNTAPRNHSSLPQVTSFLDLSAYEQYLRDSAVYLQFPTEYSMALLAI